MMFPSQALHCTGRSKHDNIHIYVSGNFIWDNKARKQYGRTSLESLWCCLTFVDTPGQNSRVNSNAVLQYRLDIRLILSGITTRFAVAIAMHHGLILTRLFVVQLYARQSFAHDSLTLCYIV